MCTAGATGLSCMDMVHWLGAKWCPTPLPRHWQRPQPFRRQPSWPRGSRSWRLSMRSWRATGRSCARPSPSRGGGAFRAAAWTLSQRAAACQKRHPRTMTSQPEQSAQSLKSDSGVSGALLLLHSHCGTPNICICLCPAPHGVQRYPAERSAPCCLHRGPQLLGGRSLGGLAPNVAGPNCPGPARWVPCLVRQPSRSSIWSISL